jgi:hypothetical protein
MPPHWRIINAYYGLFLCLWLIFEFWLIAYQEGAHNRGSILPKKTRASYKQSLIPKAGTVFRVFIVVFFCLFVLDTIIGLVSIDYVPTYIRLETH